MKKIKYILFALTIVLVFSQCEDTKYPEIDKPDPNRQGINQILSFDFSLSEFAEFKEGDKIQTEIDTDKDSITVFVPWYVSKLIRPQITVSDNASLSPISGSIQDFSQSPMIYTVRAENGSKKTWKVYMKWLEEPEPGRDNNPRHLLEETDKYKVYKIPTYSNSYLATNDMGTRLGSGASLSTSNGLVWTTAGTTERIKLYFTVRYKGELQLALRGRAGNAAGNTLNVKVKVNGVPAKKENDGTDYDYNYLYTKTNVNTDTLILHRVALPEIPEGQVAHTIELDMGVVGTRSGSYYFYFPELWVSGWATRGSGGYSGTGLNWVPSASATFGRRGPSVHIKPDKPDGEMEYFYSEVFIPEGQDILNSYFMCNGFGEGYAGIQVNSLTDRRVLFSIWNAVPETTPADPRAGRYAPRLVRVNNQSEYRRLFTYTVFSGEGTGGQSRYNAMWPAGKVLKMLTRVRPHPDQVKYPYSSLYKAWFHNGTEWVFVAEWRRAEILAVDNNGVQPTLKWYTGAHHFLENFGPATGHLTRYGTWNNDYYIGRNGTFYECEKYTFTNDATAGALERVDYAGGVMPSGNPQSGAIFLKMGGYFTNNIKSGTPFMKTLNGNSPQLDFAALNAMGTDDPAADKAVSGLSTSPLDGSEKYTE
ncbi:DUF3472 domain-containing protein [Dysgonomonas reticulitermitis]